MRSNTADRWLALFATPKNRATANTCGFHRRVLACSCFTMNGGTVQQRLCTVEGCTKRLVARGLCSMHYYRLTKTGTLAARLPRLCSVTGCTKKHFGKGFCAMHWARKD